MPAHIAVTGPAYSLAEKLSGAAGRRAKTFWARDQEGHKLIKEMARRVKQDGSIPYEIRDTLAADLPSRVGVQPDVRGALTFLLEGRHVPEAESALSQLIGELCNNVVAWPEGFDAAAFGAIAAAHAAAGVNAVKATEREAAHVDAVGLRELMMQISSDTAQREQQNVEVIVERVTAQLRATQSDPSDRNEIRALLLGPLRQAGQEDAAEAVIDLERDGGPHITDRVGHAAGDALLIAVAGLRAGPRRDDPIRQARDPGTRWASSRRADIPITASSRLHPHSNAIPSLITAL